MSEKVFKENSQEYTLAIMASILVIIMATGLFSIEYKKKIVNILKASKKGRKTFLFVKYMNSLFISAIVYISIYLPYYINIWKGYSPKGLDIPIQSIEWYKNLKLSVSIIGFLILMNILRFFGLFIVAVVSIFISVFIKNYFLSIMVSSSIILLPMLIQLFGFDIKYYSLNASFLLTDCFFNTDTWKVFIYFIVWSILMILLFRNTYFNYICRKGRK